ncbi:MAG TPA: aspartate/glutamate racemase family protein [Thermoleophilia bacterium]|nr:aspartate/glutamate racemase family protein [Thermoleophilia bacterium]
MKTILVIEPVIVPEGEDEAGYLATVKDADTTVRFVSLTAGPPSIETFNDEAMAVAEMLPVIETEAGSADAIVINCMADPGVQAVRELVDVPVVGPAEASVSLAMQLGHSFAIVTIFDNGAPWTELQVRAMGVESRLAAAVGVDIPVLELEQDLEKTTAYLLAAARDCVENRGADVLILGCTGMYPVVERIRQELDVPVIEPLSAAFKTAETLATLGLAHSHRGLYRRPDLRKCGS